MDDEHVLDEIREYVRQNRETYTRDAMRQRLVADGMPAEAVDRIIDEEEAAAVERDAARPAAIDSEARSNARRIMTGVAAASSFGYLLIVLAAVITAFSGESPVAFVAVLVAGLALEAYLARVYARSRAVGEPKLVWAITFTPIVVAVLMFGACFVAFGLR